MFGTESGGVRCRLCRGAHPLRFQGPGEGTQPRPVFGQQVAFAFLYPLDVQPVRDLLRLACRAPPWQRPVLGNPRGEFIEAAVPSGVQRDSAGQLVPAG